MGTTVRLGLFASAIVFIGGLAGCAETATPRSARAPAARSCGVRGRSLVRRPARGHVAGSRRPRRDRAARARAEAARRGSGAETDLGASNQPVPRRSSKSADAWQGSEHAQRSRDIAQVGGPAPELEIVEIAGSGPMSLAEARGKIVVVEFFGEGCNACERSFAGYQSLVSESHGAVAVIAVDVDEPSEESTRSLRKLALGAGATFPIVSDAGHRTAAKYKPIDLPTTFVIDREGKVRHLHARRAGDVANIADEVRALLAE